MYDLLQQIKIGSSSSSTSFAAFVGTTCRHPTLGADGGPATFRLVKFASAITSPSNLAVVTALSSTTGVPTWTCDTTNTANNYLVAGVIPTMSAAIAANDYGWIQIDGIAKVISVDVVLVAGQPFGTATLSDTPGRVQGVATATTLASDLAASVFAKRLGIALLSVTAVSSTSYVRIDRLL